MNQNEPKQPFYDLLAESVTLFGKPDNRHGHAKYFLQMPKQPEISRNSPKHPETSPNNTPALRVHPIPVSPLELRHAHSRMAPDKHTPAQ